MEQKKKSGPAIFMDCVILLAIALALACFAAYYSGWFPSGTVLWTGITAFTITYHFKMRLILGEITQRCHIRYDQRWFREHPFERRIYRLLQVKHWKDKALTYNPELFSVKDRTLEQIANAMAKAETDHWLNELVSLSTIFFALIWGEAWIFVLTAIIAMAFDAQFILIQRYNRPRVVKLLKKKQQRQDHVAVTWSEK